MLDRLVAATDAIYMAQDRDDLFSAVEKGCASFGFDGFLMFCHKTSKQEMILDATMTNFAGSFLQDYERLDWSDDDFMLDRVLASDAPVVWNTSEIRYDEIRKQSYIDFMHASQLRTGVVVPLRHRPGTSSAFAVSCTAGRPLLAGMTQAAKIMATAAMARAEALNLCPSTSEDVAASEQRLSSIQLDILDWVSEGKSNPDIAVIMGISERTVRYHMTEILRKLGVATRMQAAAARRSLAFSRRL